MRAGAGVAALVLAAGQGTRLAAARPKAFVELAGRTLLDHSIGRLVESGVIDLVQPVLPAAECAGFVPDVGTDRDVCVAPPIAVRAAGRGRWIRGCSSRPLRFRRWAW